jgi:DNA replication protein DnaD
MALFDSLSPKEFVILANLIAFTLSEGKSAEDNNMLGTFITAIGTTILSISTQQQNIEPKEDKKDEPDQSDKLYNDLP